MQPIFRIYSENGDDRHHAVIMLSNGVIKHRMFKSKEEARQYVGKYMSTKLEYIDI